jgi:hypothetical protein
MAGSVYLIGQWMYVLVAVVLAQHVQVLCCIDSRAILCRAAADEV